MSSRLNSSVLSIPEVLFFSWVEAHPAGGALFGVEWRWWWWWLRMASVGAEWWLWLRAASIGVKRMDTSGRKCEKVRERSLTCTWYPSLCFESGLLLIRCPHGTVLDRLTGRIDVDVAAGESAPRTTCTVWRAVLSFGALFWNWIWKCWAGAWWDGRRVSLENIVFSDIHAEEHEGAELPNQGVKRNLSVIFCGEANVVACRNTEPEHQGTL